MPTSVYKNLRDWGFRDWGFGKDLGIQRFGDSGIQGFEGSGIRDLGIQGFGDSEIQRGGSLQLCRARAQCSGLWR